MKAKFASGSLPSDRQLSSRWFQACVLQCLLPLSLSFNTAFKELLQALSRTTTSFVSTLSLIRSLLRRVISRTDMTSSLPCTGGIELTDVTSKWSVWTILVIPTLCSVLYLRMNLLPPQCFKLWSNLLRRALWSQLSISRSPINGRSILTSSLVSRRRSIRQMTLIRLSSVLVQLKSVFFINWFLIPWWPLKPIIILLGGSPITSHVRTLSLLVLLRVLRGLFLGGYFCVWFLEVLSRIKEQFSKISINFSKILAERNRRWLVSIT